MVHRLAAVEHLRRYPATTLDRRTLTILREQLTTYLTDYETLVRRMLDDGVDTEEYRREFEGEVADVGFCLAEINFAMAQQDRADFGLSTPAPADDGFIVGIKMRDSWETAARLNREARARQIANDPGMTTDAEEARRARAIGATNANVGLPPPIGNHTRNRP